MIDGVGGVGETEEREKNMFTAIVNSVHDITRNDVTFYGLRGIIYFRVIWLIIETIMCVCT